LVLSHWLFLENASEIENTTHLNTQLVEGFELTIVIVLVCMCVQMAVHLSNNNATASLTHPFIHFRTRFSSGGCRGDSSPRTTRNASRF